MGAAPSDHADVPLTPSEKARRFVLQPRLNAVLEKASAPGARPVQCGVILAEAKAAG